MVTQTWIATDRPDHPFADPKKARAVIAELPAQNALKALEEIAFWLDSVTRTEGIEPAQRFEAFDLLDQAAKNHHVSVAREYLRGSRLQKFQENRLWSVSFDFWKALAAAYIQLVEQFQADVPGTAALRKDMPAIVARALRAITLQLKWTLLRYGAVEDRIWGDLNRLYLFAESHGFAAKLVSVYPGLHGESSVQRELLKTLMLSMSSTDSLVPLALEVAERLVAYFGDRFILTGEPFEACHFSFDLSMRKPPARVIKGVDHSSVVRYFGAGKGLEGLLALKDEIAEKGAVPADIPLGGSYDVAVVTPVLEHLAQYWADKPPARHSERRFMASRMTVVHGFADVLRCLQPQGGTGAATTPDLVDTDSTESWIVENVSDGGYGAIIPQVRGDWVRVGSLVGFRTETRKQWSAGVVRRITRDEYQQRRVGIQTLGKVAIAISLTPTGTISTINAVRDGDVAVLLSAAPDENQEVTVLMRVGTFTPQQELEMRVRGKGYLVQPVTLLEGGEDFDWVRLRLLRRL